MQVVALENGPILVTAQVDGEEKKVALCRCGETKSEQGFCDGNHRKVGFEAPEFRIIEDEPSACNKESCCQHSE